MPKAYISVLILVAVALTALGVLAYRQHAEIAVLKQANKSLTEATKRAVARDKAARQVLVARQALVASMARQLAASTQKLQNALQAHNSWSNTDVPLDVQKALSGAGSGLDGASGGVPNSPLGD